MKTKNVCFAGVIPPPITGFSLINRSMHSRLADKYSVSRIASVDPLGGSSKTGRWNLVCSFFAQYESFYLALSGGKRQWLENLLVLWFTLRRVPVFIHHHSFAYIDRRKLSTALLVWLAPNATHIVLCKCMAERLMNVYSLNSINIRQVSNAAFLDGLDQPIDESARTGSLRVGFLSNITLDKGIVEYFEVIEAAALGNINVSGVIAGPLAPEVKDFFGKRIKEFSNVDYRGPVYADSKKHFFESIDVLFFPTRYVNEAEPVTILEALGHGIPVISFSRGCIKEVVMHESGLVVEHSDDFVRVVLQRLSAFASDPSYLLNSKISAKREFKVRREHNISLLDNLIEEMGCNKFVVPQQS